MKYREVFDLFYVPFSLIKTLTALLGLFYKSVMANISSKDVCIHIFSVCVERWAGIRTMFILPDILLEIHEICKLSHFFFHNSANFNIPTSINLFIGVQQ